MEGWLLLLLGIGGAHPEPLWRWTLVGKRALPSQVSGVATSTKVRAWVLWWQRQEEFAEWPLVGREVPLEECWAEQTLEHFPVRDGRGSPRFCGPQKSWLLGQNHRWQGRQGGLSSPCWQPLSLNTAYTWHVTAKSNGPVRHLRTLPPW